MGPRVAFEGFTFDTVRSKLEKDGKRVKLNPQPARLLGLLLAQPGQLVSRDAIHKELWSDETFVDFDLGINSCVRQIRAALGDNAQQPRFVETVPSEGYRFLAPVHEPTAAQKPRRIPRATSRRLVAFLAVAGAIAAAATVRKRFEPWSSPSPSPMVIDSLAVLPFANLTGDAEQEYFVDGMTDELISQLSQVHALRVISRTSVMQYKETDKPIPKIARELGVQAILEGTVRRSSGRVRITANLVEVPSGRNLWTRSFEREHSDVLVLQSELAEAIVAGMATSLTPDESLRLADVRVVDPRAHDALLKGRYHFQRLTPKDLKESIRHLEAAVARDPDYGEAYAALALTYALMPNLFVLPSSEGYARAKQYAAKAISLNEELEDAYVALGWSYACYDHAWVQAEEALRRAVEIAPSSAAAHARFGWVLTFMGRHDEALEHHREALRLDPLSALVGQEYAGSLTFARRFDDAVQQAKSTLALHPDDFFSHLRLGVAYLAKEDYPAALDVFERTRQLPGDPVRSTLPIAHAYALMGRKETARQMIDSVIKTEEGRRAYFLIAVLYVALGEREQALDLLERAYEIREPNLGLAKVSPFLDPIRDEPRFQALLRKMHLRSEG